METTAATYIINVTTDEGIATFYKTMPTTPKTNKGRKAHNTRLENYAMKQYPNWKEINVKLLP